ncbi:lariat debranching enzyme [Nitzschia inconspicua]|uniref:Lariat debranching enzyme n=1 Tax=Nitzschia inconspicua TaxID=303405 RepID=A0A9K3L823_9STRA|nr:lariat debranching enzyme [Nitzschia inconspicua]
MSSNASARGGFRDAGRMRGRGGGRGGGRGRGAGGRWRNNNNNNNFHRGGGRGGRGRGGSTGGGRGPLHYDPSKFDPIEEIGCIDQSSSSQPTVRIAVEGCCHGELDVIYQRLQDHERTTGHKIDLLLCCGDFQSHRNAADFLSSSIPPKYRTLGTFPKYYSGEKSAPILTVFIGGNHEASQPLRELYYGGWVAPNIYYLGAAGVIEFAGLRIGGISGIYKSHDYELGHFESVPYDNSSLRSVYHVRNVDVLRMKCLSLLPSAGRRMMDIVMSHDWPLGIEQFGDLNRLLQQKPFFRQEINNNDLGSPPNREILDAVQPKHWFSAHLHVKFKATVRHSASNNDAKSNKHDFMSLIPSQVTADKMATDKKTNEDEKMNSSESPPKDDDKNIELPSDPGGNENKGNTKTEFHGLESSKAKCNDVVGDLTEQMTRFLALDKCLPRRQFLSILNIKAGKTSTKPYTLNYDPEWLAILRKTHQLNIKDRRTVQLPNDVNEILTAEDFAEETAWVVNRLKSMAQKENVSTEEASSFLSIPNNFVTTVPFYSDPAFQDKRTNRPLPLMGNPITDSLLEMLELEHIITVPYNPELTAEKISLQLQGAAKARAITVQQTDSNEIDIDLDEISDAQDSGGEEINNAPIPASTSDENEIDIDMDGDDEEVDLAATTESGSSVKKKARLDERSND